MCPLYKTLLISLSKPSPTPKHPRQWAFDPPTQDSVHQLYAVVSTFPTLRLVLVKSSCKPLVSNMPKLQVKYMYIVCENSCTLILHVYYMLVKTSCKALYGISENHNSLFFHRIYCLLGKDGIPHALWNEYYRLENS